jgi:hypothetical protein
VDLSLLPPALRDHAVFLGGEAAWHDAVARDVVAALRRQGIAVIGVEVWLAETEGPKVWGWSEYEVRAGGDWSAFVEQNSALALAELQKDVPAEALWHFTLLREGESLQK